MNRQFYFFLSNLNTFFCVLYPEPPRRQLSSRSRAQNLVAGGRGPLSRTGNLAARSMRPHSWTILPPIDSPAAAQVGRSLKADVGSNGQHCCSELALLSRLLLLMSFYCLASQDRTFITMLSRNGEEYKYPYLVPDFRGKAFSFSLEVWC